MKLCIGTTIKLIYLCRNKNVSSISIGEKMLRDYGDINDSMMTKWKTCKNELNSKYCNEILNTAEEINKREFEKIANELLISVIEANKINGVIASLINVIREDNDILDDTVIGFNPIYTKKKIILEKNIDAVSFLANVLYFVETSKNNKDGRPGIEKINENYIKNSINEIKGLNVSYLETERPSSTRKAIPCRKYPFTYYSNSCSFVGRELELQALKEFICYSEQNIRWWTVVGAGGTGKSRLAYEFIEMLDKDVWDTYVINRDTGLSFEIISNIVNVGQKKIFLLVDLEIADLEPVARWMSYQHSKRVNTDICILICQRLKKKISDKELSPWYASMIEYNEIVGSFEYNSSIGSELYLNKLDRDSLYGIASSYISTMYPEKNQTRKDIEEILKKLKEVDPHYLRPLFLLFISDAIANDAVSGINSEDSLLEYAFLRERNYIRSIIKDAFGYDYIHNKKLYNEIERCIAENSKNIYSGRSFSLSGEEYTGMSKDQFLSITDAYGLTTNGKINFIEPDMLAEYFYIKYSAGFCGATVDQAFWVTMFRDYNYLITTKYRDFLKQFFPYCSSWIGLYYIQGIYEAFCMTDSMNERERLISLINNFENDFKEWVGDDPLYHPYGSEMTINMFYMMQGERLNRIRKIMAVSIETRVEDLPEQKYDLYDSYLGNRALEIYKEIEDMLTNEQNAIPLLDKLNALTKLYENNTERNTEIPFYYSHALYYAVIFFFARGVEYEDELAIQIAKKIPEQLMRIYKTNGTKDALINYIQVLMILYIGDRHCFYSGKNELLSKICKLNEECMEDSTLNPIFELFFNYIGYTPSK